MSTPKTSQHAMRSHRHFSSIRSDQYKVHWRRNILDETLALVHFAQVAAFTSAGFLHRKGLQYHWRNRDRSSSANDINNNNGAKKGATTSSTVSGDATGALSTATPAETAEQALVVGEGGENGGKMYRDFDAYLGNFASKRRIKVCKNAKAMTARERGGGLLCGPGSELRRKV